MKSVLYYCTAWLQSLSSPLDTLGLGVPTSVVYADAVRQLDALQLLMTFVSPLMYIRSPTLRYYIH
jgi:hypothetical protein